MREFHQDPPYPSPMITLDHLGESSVLIFYISYIEDNAYFKFGGIGEISLCFKIFLAASIILSFVFSFICLYVLVAFIGF